MNFIPADNNVLSDFFLRMIMRMEKFMGFLAKRLFQEFLINLFYVRIFMRFPQLLSFILTVKGAYSGISDFVIGLPGLTAAADASARTAHDFDKVIVCFAFHYLFHELFGIAQSVRYRDPDFHAFQERPLRHSAFDFNRSFLYTFKSGNRSNMKFPEWEIFPCTIS